MMKYSSKSLSVVHNNKLGHHISWPQYAANQLQLLQEKIAPGIMLHVHKNINLHQLSVASCSTQPMDYVYVQPPPPIPPPPVKCLLLAQVFLKVYHCIMGLAGIDTSTLWNGGYGFKNHMVTVHREVKGITVRCD